MAKNKTVEEVDTPALEPTEKAVPESISLNDLQVLLQIVDLASQRGAFRGAELTQVGAIFDKLNAFLTFIAEQQKARDDATQEDTKE